MSHEVRSWRGTVSVLFAMAVLAAGCRPPPAKMEAGQPIEVRRGYCIGETQFKQRGEPKNRDSVMDKLSRHSASRAQVRQGNTLAILSIISTLAAGTALVTGSLAEQDVIEMSQGSKMIVIGSGIVLAGASWALCIASDGQYAAAAESYSASLPRSGSGSDDDRTRSYEQSETWK
jgi:hypothetical protein